MASWDFTADSENQVLLAKDINTAADDFDGQIKNLYTEIDNLSLGWVGEDYDSFKEGTNGYSQALQDLSNSMRMFAEHYEKVATGTDTLATELINIVNTCTTRFSDQAAGNEVGTGVQPADGTMDETENGSQNSNSTEGDPTKTTSTPEESESFWGKVGGRYKDDWNDMVGDVKDRWSNANGLISGTFALADTVVEGADFLVDATLDTAEGALDAVDYGANWLFDLGTGRGGSNSGDYWKNIGKDYSENWDALRNADNFWEGAGGVLTGTLRTAADLGQTTINAADTALDWCGDRISDVVDWAGDTVGKLGGWLFG